MERRHGELLREIAGAKDEMRTEFASVRREVSAVRERVVRVETLLVGKEPPPSGDDSADPR